MDEPFGRFREEARERLTELALAILALEQSPDATEPLQQAFRAAHSLKGGGRLAGLRDMEEVAQGLEELLGAIRAGQLSMSPSLGDLLLRAHDDLERRAAGEGGDSHVILQTLRTAVPPPADDLVSEAELRQIFLEGVGEALEEFSQALLTLEQSPNSPEAIHTLFRVGHNLKGKGGSLGFSVVSRLGHEMENLLDRVRSGKTVATAELADTLFQALDALQGIVKTIQEGGRVTDDPPVTKRLRALAAGEKISGAPPVDPPATEVGPLPSLATSEDSIRVRLPRLDLLVNLTGELLINHRRGEAVTDRFNRALHLTRCIRDGNQSESKPLLDQLEAELVGLVEEEEERTLRVGVTLSALQAEVLRVRMLPVGSLFQSVPRLIRDLGRRQGKAVRLAVQGGETELDKRILEHLADPLLHLIRNAVDHGIEPAEERARAGKAPHGTIRLSAYQQGGQVVIQVEDDGRGLNLKALREKAVALGHLDAQAAGGLSDVEVARLVFLPGLSTRETVTEISGRGVGMDVVQANVERLKGVVEVETVAGRGTNFRLRLPLTLAILETLVIRLGAWRYCLPSTAVVEGLEVSPTSLDRVGTSLLLAHRGETIPVVPLARLVGEPEGPSADPTVVVVLEALGQRLGVIVDQLLEVQDVVLKGLGRLLSEVPALAGTTILGDGGIALVLDPVALFRMARSRAGAPVPALSTPTSTPRAPRALVVDDSFPARELMRGVLEASGFEVRLAGDGVEALERLAKEPFDLVLTDIMMPRMDGVVLTRRLRAEPAFRRLPIVVVTSLDKEEERCQGLEAGADAYITKGAFDQDHLLTVVEGLLARGLR